MVVKGKLGFGVPTINIGHTGLYEEGDGCDEELADNLPKLLSECPAGGIHDGSVLSLSDFVSDLEVKVVVRHVDESSFDEKENPEKFLILGQAEFEKKQLQDQTTAAAALAASQESEGGSSSNTVDDSDDVVLVHVEDLNTVASAASSVRASVRALCPPAIPFASAAETDALPLKQKREREGDLGETEGAIPEPPEPIVDDAGAETVRKGTKRMKND